MPLLEVAQRWRHIVVTPFCCDESNRFAVLEIHEVDYVTIETAEAA
jgi:hypothetical protein